MSNYYLKAYSDNDLWEMYQVTDRLYELVHLHQTEMCKPEDFKTASTIYQFGTCLLEEIARREERCDYVQHFDPS